LALDLVDLVALGMGMGLVLGLGMDLGMDQELGQLVPLLRQ
tara:strand:+ start:512 stop:634 length:123 start_codon:yes stop_codon:yes gene_type:complete